MKIGWAKQNITPPIPIYMAGYEDRKEPAQGIKDPLYAKTIVLEDSRGEKAAFISADLLYITKSQTEIIRDKVNELTGIARDHIIICSTHTHSGPLTFEYPAFGELDNTYVDFLLDAIPRIVLKASNKTIKSKLGWYQRKVDGIGSNRRNPNIRGDTYLTVLSFVDFKNRPLAVMFNYNCHPTVLPAENIMISGEYPSAAVDLLEKVYGKDVLFMFSNGASGDISTRFTRRSQTFEEKNRLGRILASEVIKAIEKIKYEEHNYIAILEKKFKLKERETPDEDHLNKVIVKYENKLTELKNNKADNGEIRLIKTAIQGAVILKRLKKYRNILEYDGSMTAIGLGNGCILAQPAELFSSLGNRIMNKSVFDVTMIMGYSNGCIGYIPHRDSYLNGGYESLSCRFEIGAGEELTDIAIELIKELKI